MSTNANINTPAPANTGANAKPEQPVVNPPGLQDIALGDVVRLQSIEKFRGRKNEPAIIAIISANIKAAYIHFEEGVGYFYCFGGVCCERLGPPSVRYIIPIIQYKIYNYQTLEYGPPITLKYLALGQTAYESLLTKSKVLSLKGKSLTTVDILVTCQDEVYQKLEFDVLDSCKWCGSPDLQQQVAEFLKEFDKLIVRSVARTLSEDMYNTIISTVVPPASPNITPPPSTATANPTAIGSASQPSPPNSLPNPQVGQAQPHTPPQFQQANNEEGGDIDLSDITDEGEI